jgi:hypothetical protein
MTNITEISHLLESKFFKEIESTIVKKLNCELYRDDSAFIFKLLGIELDTSTFSLAQLKEYIFEHPDELALFSENFLSRYNPKVLSVGFSISHAIYVLYLKNGTRKELTEYLRRRRIPKSKDLSEELFEIKERLFL